MYNTSKKTYETAAILKQRGADERTVSRLLKSSMDHYYSRAQLIHQARLFEGKYIIAAAVAEDLIFDRTEIAAAADDLLNVQDVKATFVLGRTDEKGVSISARSAGDVNVQLIMEVLGGGGHLTNAAVRLEGTIADAIRSLEVAILEQHKK
jgi:c-di-AMP phosphodiesterase-like protein